MPHAPFRITSFFLLGLLALANLLGTDTALAANLSRVKIEAICKATFEVVVLKPVDDPLSYERPLPLDLIPFAIRNDLYYSVGTAFAIGANQWLTAGHVLNIGHKSQFKTYRLRDHNGKVYEIDELLKHSLQRDFVVFTVKNPPKVRPLPINAAARLNSRVYAVGNALGQGIVFRDGLYTSATPEEQDGKWKWMRFSAAASPGNSGGPLLDQKGQVIGVVIGKSENENLNFALPINEVLQARDGISDIDVKMMYMIDNMPNMSVTDRFRKETPLPKTYLDLDAQLTADFYNYGMKLQNDFFAQQHDHVFPNSEQSLALLNTDYNMTAMLGIISKGEDGMWDVFSPQKTSTSDLGKNGSLIHGSHGQSETIRLLKPDDIELGALYQDSKLLLDMVLRGYPLYRTIGSERIKITSMGKAAEEYIYPDRYGRKWLVRVWNIPYSDEQVVLFALPTPGGFKGMMRTASTGNVPGIVEDLKVFADLSYLSYYGTLAQWRDFLTQRELLPQPFSDIKVDFEYGKFFRYTSKRIAFSYSSAEMGITEQSDLKLRFSYFIENGKTVWDVTNIVAGESNSSSTFFGLARNIQPQKHLNDSFQSAWDNITQRRHPYNKQTYFSDKRTLIGDVFARKIASDKLAGAPVLYTVFYGADGNLEHKGVAAKLNRFVGKLTTTEY